MPALFNFISLELTLKYLGLCFLAVVGALQIVAGRRDIRGLSLLPAPLRRRQILLGTALIVVAFAVFFAITPEVFTPGLAGAELITLFGVGAIAALFFTLGVAQAQWKPPWSCVRPDELMEFPRCDGVLLRPEPGRRSAMPPSKDATTRTLCLVPDPAEPCSLDKLGKALAKAGFNVLLLRWKGPLDFEGAMGVLALAMQELVQKYGLRWVGVIGHRLGGDIALRFTGEDEEVKAVVAIAPFLNPAGAEASLDCLKEAPILTAHRRLRGKAKMVKALAPLEHLGELKGRPCLIITNAASGLEGRDNIRVIKLAAPPWQTAISNSVVKVVKEWLK